MDILSADGISVRFNPAGGIIHEVVIETGGQTLRPLHCAPWVRNGEALPDNVAPVERQLAGDFFCAPFAVAEPDIPIHGWAANGAWEHAGTVEAQDGGVTAEYKLHEPVAGARLTKRITLYPGQPIVYQTHIFDGGVGRLPIAHHAMLHVPGGAKLSFSPKSAGRTPPGAPETDAVRGTSILAYPQEFSSLSSVRRSDGTFVDAGMYPFEKGHEDLIVLSENAENRIGWSAAVAREDGFLFFAVKDARMLPQTVLWMSNGGRYYAPWNSRHIAVLGIEEAATALHLMPEDQRDRDAAPDGQAVPVALHLSPLRSTAIRYAFGAIPVPTGWSEVIDIKLEFAAVTLTDCGGDVRIIPFNGRYFDDPIQPSK